MSWPANWDAIITGRECGMCADGRPERARALIALYRPLKMNYETLGNTLPHLHTHLIPRYREDPAPGAPFPLAVSAAGEIEADRLEAEAAALRQRLDRQ